MSLAVPALKIDIVSDVSCPWCAIGLSGLLQAIAQLQGEVDVTLHCQPFELNPKMGPGGQDIGEHLTEKYGSSPEQQAQIRDMIRARGAAVGFEFNADGRGRIYNTFDAHRLLLWAAQVGKQDVLLENLYSAYFEKSEPVFTHSDLLTIALRAGLVESDVVKLLQSDEYGEQVKADQELASQLGANGVPFFVFDMKYGISGAQPQVVFNQTLATSLSEYQAN